MYTQHFHLAELPFSIAPNPRYLYLSPQHREALAHLLYGIGVGGGFVVLTGEVGTGKTTLCRALLEQLPDDVDIALIFNPRLNSRELLAGICDELHIPYSGPRASLKQLIDALNEHLLDSHARGRRVIVLIDEAQNLRFDVLEQVRLLTNLETNQAKLLQIILVGQPELNQILDRPNLRQLAQRITARYHLNPLSLAETRDYVRHRMVVAGGSDRVFTGPAIRTIHRRAGGIPRLINLIADRALLGAYTVGKTRVGGRVVRRAAGELMAKGAAPSRRRLAVLLGLLAAVTAGAIYLDALPNPLVRWLAQAEPPAPPTPVDPLPPATPDLPVNPVPATPAPPANPAPEPPTVTEPVPQAAEVSVPQPEAIAPPPVAPPVFVEWLGNPKLDKSSALTKLLSLWSLSVPGDIADPCAWAATQGLRCQPMLGSWLQLTALNLAAVLEFVLPSGELRYAVVARVEQGQVELATQEVTERFPAGELLQLWSGNIIAVWKPPVTEELINLYPGVKSPLIAWIRQRLGQPASNGDANQYDRALMVKVIEFQQSRGLKPDGIVGTLTLLSLQSASQDTGIPRLHSASP